MKRIKVKFADFPCIRAEDSWLYRLLTQRYDVELSDSPEYLLDGGLGDEHLKYDCIKVVFVGESYVPDFNQFDYAMGFDYLEFGDRYLRLPLFATYGEFHYLSELRARPVPDERLLNRGFCSFVVSNEDGDPARIEFFRRLSKYKPVASGGKVLNNVGGRVPDKNAFLAKYKFNIAFENSCVPGYTTEKVMQPLAVGSVPIYYGNPRIGEDFDPACMVRVASRDDMDRAIEEIVALDRDDAAYLQRVRAPAARQSVDWYMNRVADFLGHIIDQSPAEARRLNAYGYQTNIRRRALAQRKAYRLMHPGEWF